MAAASSAARIQKQLAKKIVLERLPRSIRVTHKSVEEIARLWRGPPPSSQASKYPATPWPAASDPALGVSSSERASH
jgi:hypothetical protein